MRIVVRCRDARAARETQALLSAARVDAVAIPGAPRTAPEGEDVVIVAAPDGDMAAATASLADNPTTLLNLAALPVDRPPPLGLGRSDVFAGAVAIDAATPLLMSQIAAALRLGVMEEEFARRARTAAAFDHTLPATQDVRALRALYIGAPSPVFLALENALTALGGVVDAAFSSFAGFDHLHDEAFDAVVLNGAQDPVTAVSLCAALRRNASLYHLPTMVVTAARDEATSKAAIERGAAAIAPADAPCGASLGWLFEAIRRERRRRAAEHGLRALRDLMGDTRTGLFQRAAFDAHLQQLANDHHASGRPLSLAVLRVLPAHGASMPTEKVWRRGFTEIASLAARLMRDTDSGAAIGGDLIAIALPAAALKSAKRTAERIASVAECTAFAAGEGGVGPLVFEQSSVELQPGESGIGMLARALYALDVQSVPA